MITLIDTAMQKPIYPCIWSNNNALEMAEFYVSVFPDAEIVDQNSAATVFTISGQRILILNGGNLYRPNPSISLMYLTEDANDVVKIHSKLKEGSMELMPLDSYPFSPKYSWIEDRYGVSWQLYTGDAENIIQKVVPTIMCIGLNNGRAEEAMKFYTSVFPRSEMRGILRYTGEEGEAPGNIMHAEFKILDYLLMIMDSSYPHNFELSEGMSLVVECDTQDEIDAYWSKLTSDGGLESMCGWLKDKFGVSWQITPSDMKDLVQKPGVMHEMMKMKKLDIAKLRAAAK